MQELTVKDRMKIARHPMIEQDPKIRSHNYEEVNQGYTAEMAKEEALRCIQCKKPACIDGCPVNINIKDFIELIAEGDFLGAVKEIKKDNALPAICGRVCPQEEQCEQTCVLAKKGESVAIGHLERFVADFERESGKIDLPQVKPTTGKKVVFEALHELGGVLVYGIPQFRLPKEIVRKEIEGLEKMGVKFITNAVIGRMTTIDELMGKEGYDAVFVGVGAGLPWFLGIPGENLIGVYSANEFLTRINLMKAYKFPDYDSPILDCKDKNVCVFGGGNTAMDSVRTSLRLGAKNAYIVYRRSDVEMPARNEEIKHAKEEGVQFMMLTNPVQFTGDENEHLEKMTCIKMELGEPDDSGRRRPVPIKDSEFDVNIDIAVIAIGNGSNPLIMQTTSDIETSKRGTIVVDEETMKTSKKGVFAGGDIVTGGATVILAMGAGRKAAAALNDYINTGQW
jgi:glutamate synthase (NADPH/NADH) small chain